MARAKSTLGVQKITNKQKQKNKNKNMTKNDNCCFASCARKMPFFAFPWRWLRTGSIVQTFCNIDSSLGSCPFFSVHCTINMIRNNSFVDNSQFSSFFLYFTHCFFNTNPGMTTRYIYLYSHGKINIFVYIYIYMFSSSCVHPGLK